MSMSSLTGSLFRLCSPQLEAYAKRRSAALPANLTREIQRHLTASVKVAQGVKALSFGQPSTNWPKQIDCLRTDSYRLKDVLSRLAQVKRLLTSVHPQFDEIIAAIHDVGKFDAQPGVSSPFWGHSDKGYEILRRELSALAFRPQRSDISEEDIVNLLLFAVRWHIVISNYCVGERSARTLRQTLDLPFVKELMRRPELRELALAVLLDITISDVGAYGKLSLFKIERFIEAHDLMNKLIDHPLDQGDLLLDSKRRINALLGMDDKLIDSRTEYDPYLYYNQFSEGTMHWIGETALSDLLEQLAKVDKLVYFGKLWSKMAIKLPSELIDMIGYNVSAGQFLASAVNLVKGHEDKVTVVELADYRDRWTREEIVKFYSSQSRGGAVFAPELGHLTSQEYTDSFGLATYRTKIDLEGFMRRSHVVGFPSSLTYRSLYAAAFKAAGMTIVDTPFLDWQKNATVGQKVVGEASTCLTLQVTVGSFLELQKRGAGSIFRPVEDDEEHGVCCPEVSWAHAVEIATYFPHVNTGKMQRMSRFSLGRSDLGRTLSMMGLSSAQSTAFFDKFKRLKAEGSPKPYSPAALGRENGRKILLVGREKMMHPSYRYEGNLLEWLVTTYPDVSIVTPGMFPAEWRNPFTPKLKAPYEWKVDRMFPIIRKLVRNRAIAGIIYCRTANCRPANSGISFIRQELAGINFPQLEIVPSTSFQQARTRLEAFMEMIEV